MTCIAYRWIPGMVECAPLRATLRAMRKADANTTTETLESLLASGAIDGADLADIGLHRNPSSEE